MKILSEKVLPWILHNANSDPIFVYKKSFYGIKDQILRKYGKHIAYDIQHIVKGCYTCGGTGIYSCGWKPDETCWNCHNGIYKEFFVLLTVYQFGKYEFHIPKERTSSPKHWWASPDNQAIRRHFDDYINHRALPWSSDCCLLLFAFYKPGIFWKLLGRIAFNQRTPLALFFTLFFELNPSEIFRKIEWEYNALRSRWYRYRHPDCDEWDLPF